MLFDLLLNRRVEELTYRNDIDAGFELVITHCLAQIVEQAHEIADTIMQWLDGKDCVRLPERARGVSMRGDPTLSACFDLRIGYFAGVQDALGLRLQERP